MAMVGDTLRRVEIRFPLTFSAIVAVVYIGLAIWYWDVSLTTRDWLVFVVIGATAVGQITMAFYTARVLGVTINREARDSARESAADVRAHANQQFILKKEALRFGERWNDPAMYLARDMLRSIVAHKNKPVEELLVFIQDNETGIHHIMNFLEEMSTCCRHQVVDTELVKDQFDLVIIVTWETLFPWIRQKRQEGFPRIWEDIERIYDQWKRP